MSKKFTVNAIIVAVVLTNSNYKTDVADAYDAKVRWSSTTPTRRILLKW